MARQFHPTSMAILNFLSGKSRVKAAEIKAECAPRLSAKDFYNYLFRLEKQELIIKSGANVNITSEGEKLLKRLMPKKDGVWKLVIFEFPEKHKYVRSVVRAKLKQLHFKKWQNSVWISPFELDEEIEKELNELGKKFFVRLIKTNQINHTQDLAGLFDT